MPAALLDLPLFESPNSVPRRNASALKTLMHAWEHESADEEENEADLMIALSQMASPAALSLNDE